MYSDLNVLLGSASPRRKELLSSIVSSFDVLAKNVSEEIPSSVVPADAAKYLAEYKADAFDQEVKNGKTVITADTTVLLGDKILEKPANANEAFDMLSALSGTGHVVRTGVCIRNNNQKIVFDEATKVHFRELKPEEIRFYIQKFTPFDKAGGYGIQEWIGMVGITAIEGCFYNVKGLPTRAVYEALRTL